ncbi:hypothetical protein OHT59_13520 [Streptomyces sp. NBC_00243]|uniref:hypothetical protein n=1 Tax=Streptomyces sp. NBC_00243 TaxID=2975688 RepID=UPI002DD87B57|nr:hypothetical protein [Streptomyces sp. NBC_00243]WRZ19438.1 hypothetical protein OHT59_13520 [Streptomyces sp. NBC_00243]
MITHSDQGPDFDPDDPLAVILRPASDYLGPPPGRYEAIRRGAARRRLLRAAAGIGLSCAVAAIVTLPIVLATPEVPVSPTVPLAPPPASSPPATTSPTPTTVPSTAPTPSATPGPVDSRPTEGSRTPSSRSPSSTQAPSAASETPNSPAAEVSTVPGTGDATRAPSQG